MLFSLIIPVYNTEKYLETCFESIRSQDFDDYEVIIVDDGSTDGSSALCDDFCERLNDEKKRSVARVIHQENHGPGHARNTGLKEAKGDWIWFIDSDDFIVPGALSSIVERMRFAKGDMYAFQYIRTDEDGANPEYIFFREFQEKIQMKGEGDLLWQYDHRLFRYKDGWEACTRLFKREIIEKNKISFNETRKVIAEDLCFTTEYMMCIKSAIMLVNYYYCYRERGSSIMESLDQKTVIPILYNLLEDMYKEARRLKKKQCIKNFDTFCYGVLSIHIPKLDKLANEELCNELIIGTKNKLIGKYIAKVKDRLFKEIELRETE